MSPRWYDKRTGDHLALDTGGGPIADCGRRHFPVWWISVTSKRRENSVVINLPKGAMLPEATFEWKIPNGVTQLSATVLAHTSRLMPQLLALYFCEKAMEELMAGRSKTWAPFKVPEEAISCGFHEAVRGVLSHHVVIREGKIANYHPYPPTCWNANPRDTYGTPGPYEDAVCKIRRSLKRMGQTNSKALILCGLCAVLILACPAAFTCIWDQQSSGNPAFTNVRHGGRTMSETHAGE